MSNRQLTPATEVSHLYGLAYTLYRYRHYREAYPLFRVLVDVSPEKVEYWKGLAACLQMQKDYNNALKYYRHAQSLQAEQTDPYLLVYMADCQFALGQVAAALQTLHAAKKAAKAQGVERIVQHVTLMHRSWKQQNHSRK